MPAPRGPQGYSGTPLVAKLGIRPGHTVLVWGGEVDLDLPPGATVVGAARGRFDVALLFVKRRADLERRLPGILRVMPADGALWVCWPKRASKVATDMTEDVVRDVALPLGLVDNKVCAVDETWSGLRVVVRKERRAGWGTG